MTGRRELTFALLPYIVVYQVKADAVEISRIFHGAKTGLKSHIHVDVLALMSCE